MTIGRHSRSVEEANAAQLHRAVSRVAGKSARKVRRRTDAEVKSARRTPSRGRAALLHPTSVRHGEPVSAMSAAKKSVRRWPETAPLSQRRGQSDAAAEVSSYSGGTCMECSHVRVANNPDSLTRCCHRSAWPDDNTPRLQFRRSGSWQQDESCTNHSKDRPETAMFRRSKARSDVSWRVSAPFSRASLRNDSSHHDYCSRLRHCIDQICRRSSESIRERTGTPR